MSEPYSTRTLYRRVLEIARPYRAHLAGLLTLSLLSTPLGLLTPIPLKIAVDSVIGDAPLPGFMELLFPASITHTAGSLLIATAILYVSITLLSQLQGLASEVLRTWTGERLVLDFRSQLFRHAQRLSLAYHDERGTTDSTYRIRYDAPAVQWIAIDGIIPFITSTVKLVMMIWVISLINGRLALVALAVSPVLYVISRVYGNRLRGEWRGSKKLDSSAMRLIQDTLSGLRVVKAFGQEDREHDRFAGRGEAHVEATLRLTFLEAGMGLLVGLTIAIGTATVLFIGVRQVQTGGLLLGELLLVMSYLTQLYKPLETMGQKAADLQGSLASAERAFKLLDESPDVEERPNAQPLHRARGTVTFDRVAFAYDEEQVLHDISFEVPAGTRLGIAGTTGTGKTTLVSLLTRFYDPTQGGILLDGIDIRDYKLADLRNQFAIVLQEPVLFSSSIAENIAYARPGAHNGDIVAAAKAANAHDFIVRLPMGYDTPVGERGMRLSGGERQRIALARAFLKDAPIVILDEPTSAVDVKTEAAIMAAMDDLMRGRTCFMIAHRLGTLEHCDARIVIEDGRIETSANLRSPVDEAMRVGATAGERS